MCYFKILIAVRPVMGGFFFPAIAIVTVNSITTAKDSCHIGRRKKELNTMRLLAAWRKNRNH